MTQTAIQNIVAEAPSASEFQSLSPETRARIEFDSFYELGAPVRFEGANGERLEFSNRPADGSFNLKVDGIIVKNSADAEEIIRLAAKRL